MKYIYTVQTMAKAMTRTLDSRCYRLMNGSIARGNRNDDYI